jgi:hypothetical protein
MINRVDIHFEGLRTWYKLVCVLHSTLLILFHYIVLGCSKMLFLVGNFFYEKAHFCWKQSEGVVFIFSSKTSVLPWFGLKQAENELKTTHVSDQRLSLGQNARFQKWAFSACFQAENEPFINSGTVPEFIDRVLGMKMIVFGKTSSKRSFSIQSVPRDVGISLFWMRSDLGLVFKYYGTA